MVAKEDKSGDYQNKVLAWLKSNRNLDLHMYCNISNIFDMFSDYNKTSDGWLEWKGSQYYFNRDSMAMEDARRFCQQRHGDLVTVNSQAESVFLWKQVRNNIYTV